MRGRDRNFGGARTLTGLAHRLSYPNAMAYYGLALEHARLDRHGSIAAFNIETGVKQWEHWVTDYVHGTAAFSDLLNAVAIGANDNCLYLLDAITGALRWVFRTEKPIKEAPVIDDLRGLVYFGGFDGHVRAIDVVSGQLVWALRTPDVIYSTPLLIGQKVFVTVYDKNLHIINLKEHTHRRVSLGAKSTASPVLIGSSVFFGANNSVVYEINPDSETIVGRFQLPHPVTTRVTRSEQTGLYSVTTYMNLIFAVRSIGEEH
jgi:outer membrane protein assembly factor BamB